MQQLFQGTFLALHKLFQRAFFWHGTAFRAAAGSTPLPAEGPGISLPFAICCHAASRAKRCLQWLQRPMMQDWSPKRCRICRPSREVPMFPPLAAAAGTYGTLFSFADVLIAAPTLGTLIAGSGRRSKSPPPHKRKRPLANISERNGAAFFPPTPGAACSAL